MLKTMFPIIFALLFCSVHLACSNDSNTAYPVIDGKRVCVFNSMSRELKEAFFDSTDKIVESSIKASPSGKYVSMYGSWHEYYSDKCENETGERHGFFLVINVETGDVISLCNVMSNTWAAEKDLLVYIEGFTEITKGPDWVEKWYIGKAVKIFDPNTGLSQEIDIEMHSPYDVSWSKFDNHIYVYDDYENVFKYNPATGESDKTHYRYVHISPDGLYCFLKSLEGDPAQLFRNEDNSSVFITDSESKPIDTNTFWPYFLDWGLMDGKTVAYLQMNYQNLFYIDCASGQLHEIQPPSPEIRPVDDLAGFRNGRPVWAKIIGDKAELFYY